MSLGFDKVTDSSFPVKLPVIHLQFDNVYLVVGSLDRRSMRVSLRHIDISYLFACPLSTSIRDFLPRAPLSVVLYYFVYLRIR